MRDQVNAFQRVPWNKGKLTGAKPPLRPKHVWSIRTKLQIEGRTRDLAMFNLAIDSKLRGCDVVAMRVEDVAAGGCTADRATVRQRKTGRPVRFELSEQIHSDGWRPHEIFAYTGEAKAGRCAAYTNPALRLGHEFPHFAVKRRRTAAREPIGNALELALVWRLAPCWSWAAAPF
jgi:hypothetical protein